MVVRDACPACQSTPYKTNSHTHTGTQQHQCQACGRQFVASPDDHSLSDPQRTRLEHLLRERISPRGIGRAVGVTLPWRLPCMVEGVAACPEPLHGRPPAGATEGVMHQCEADADERWRCVGKSANKPWIWMAMDANPRQMIACHVGDRRRESAQELWAQIPVA